MDHIIERIEIDIELYFDIFYEELQSGKYNKYSDCPNYDSLKALVDSSNILRKHYGWERISIREMVAFRNDISKGR